VYTVDQYYLTVTAPRATLTIDGEPDDWTDIDPVIHDPEGNDPSPYTGCDIKDVYIAIDDTYLYLMGDFWDGPPNEEWGSINPFAYQFHIYCSEDSPEGESVGVCFYGNQWGLSGHNVNVDNSLVGCGSVVEVALPLADIDSPDELIRYYLQIGVGPDNYNCSGSVRVLLTQGVDSPQNLTIEISSTEVNLSWDAVTGANSYMVFSSEDSYSGFAEDTSGSFNGESWTAPLAGTQKYYYVLARSELRR